MGKRVVDDATLSVLADELRAASRQSGELVFPDDFIASAHSAHAEGYTEGHESGYKRGVDDFVTNNNLGDYYNDTIISLSFYAFAGRSSLKSITLPSLTWASNHAFYYCSELTRMSLPSYGTHPTYPSKHASNTMFYGCSRLQYVDFGMVTKISTGVFGYCYALRTIVLRNTSMVTLDNLNAFSSTPYANGGTGGIIYVPAALIEEYKTATNWSALYAYGTVEFVALEGSEYENADY